MALEKQTKTSDTEKAQQNPDGSASSRRRRLIKGAFAAPMILTLHSGAAVARTSNTPTIAVVDPVTEPDNPPKYLADQCLKMDTNITSTEASPLEPCWETTANPIPPSGIPVKCDAGLSPSWPLSGDPVSTAECKVEGGLIITASCVGSIHPA